MAGKVEWKYCECGCHGHQIRIGGCYYWLYNDLGEGPDKNNPFHLYKDGHGWLFGKLVGHFSNWKDADDAARTDARAQAEAILASI